MRPGRPGGGLWASGRGSLLSPVDSWELGSQRCSFVSTKIPAWRGCHRWACHPDPQETRVLGDLGEGRPIRCPQSQSKVSQETGRSAPGLLLLRETQRLVPCVGPQPHTHTHTHTRGSEGQLSSLNLYP